MPNHTVPGPRFLCSGMLQLILFLHNIRSRFLLLCAVVLITSGCASTGINVFDGGNPEAGVSASSLGMARVSVAADAVDRTEQILDTLIKDMNASKARNRKATRQLMRLKNIAVERLIEELDLNKKRISRHQIESALRAIRIIRRMKTPSAIDASRRILLTAEIPERNRRRDALYTEILAYLSDHFSYERAEISQKARNTYVRFLLEHKDKYLERVFYRTAWGPGHEINNTRVDVLHGVPILIKTGDPQAKDVLLHLLRVLTTESYGKFAATTLDDNGYSIVAKRFNYGLKK